MLTRCLINESKLCLSRKPRSSHLRPNLSHWSRPTVGLGSLTSSTLGFFSHGASSRSIWRISLSPKSLDIGINHSLLNECFKSNPLLRSKLWKSLSQKIFSKCKPRSTCSVPFHHFAVAGICVGYMGSKAASYLDLVSLNPFFITAKCRAKPALRRKTDIGQNQNTKSPSFQWRLFLKLLWKDAFYVISAILAAIGAAFLNIQIPLVLGELTNVVSSYASSVNQEVGNFLQDIKAPSLKLCAIYGLQSLLTFSYISLLSIVGENLASRLRLELFQSLLHQDVHFYDDHKTGELVDRLTSDIQNFKSSFKLTISQGLKAATQTIGCAMSLFVISPKLTAIMMGVIPLVVIGGTGIGSLLRKLSLDAQHQISESTAVADEALGNIRTVRAFAMEDKELELYEKQVDKARVSSIQLGIGIGAFQGASNLFLNGIVLGSLYAGGWLISNREIKSGDLISFLVATQMIERSMAQLSLLLGHVVRGLSAGSRVFEFMVKKPEVSLRGGIKIPFHSMFGDIEFSNVGFHYPSRPQQEILSDFSLRIPGGKVVALVGLSGGGKSTLAALLERFYDANQGSICIDGINLKDLDPSWLRGKAVGFINQEPVLFATSVMENIRYGRPEASDTEVVEAAKLANADGFIRSFPHGYNTVLGERGVTVSGGQKQRIAIARAIIKNPSILILDEATSALDAESESIVQEALDKVVSGRTVLVIAHRLSTIRNADMIAVVAHGRIVEIGTHSELKAKKGVYWGLVKKQEIEEDLSKT